PGQLADGRRERLRPGEGAGVAVAVRAETGDQRLAVDPRDRRLARRVDIGDQHDIGVVEAGAEAVEQIGEPGIAVRLHYRDDPAADNRPRRLQHRRDLDR